MKDHENVMQFTLNPNDGLNDLKLLIKWLFSSVFRFYFEDRVCILNMKLFLTSLSMNSIYSIKMLLLRNG